MDVIKRLRPGQPGTKRLQRQFGDRLVFVRYRHDAKSQRRFTTVELIVDEGPRPARLPDTMHLFHKPDETVHVKIGYSETELRARVKAAGGKWDPKGRYWSLPYHVARTLAITDRIVEVANVQ